MRLFAAFSLAFALPVLAAMPGHAQLRTEGGASGRLFAAEKQPAAQCLDAVHAAEARHGLPRGLLLAVSQVESGRADPTTRRVEPWPWTVQAEGQGLYFASKAEAVAWVRDASARGITSIDTGCMQVNLLYHPRAFGSVADAFDPGQNADYAARFLLQLHAETGDWRTATGVLSFANTRARDALCVAGGADARRGIRPGASPQAAYPR